MLEKIPTTLGYFLCFIFNGIITEYNITKVYGGKKFECATFYVFLQSILMIIIVLGIKIVKKDQIEIKKLFNKDLLISGCFQTLAIFCTIQMAFKLDYLIQVLLRSSKFISVLFGALIFKSK